MKTAESIRHAAILWSEFLTLNQRCYTKTRKALERTAGKGWFDNITAVRNRDPLLSYVLHARNADEHGTEDITKKAPSKIQLGLPPGNHFVEYLSIGPSGVEADPITAKKITLKFQPERLELQRVLDRGLYYDPPREHLGVPLADNRLITIAEAALVFTEKMVLDAELHC